MKCLSCGSSATDAHQEACSYCGAILNVKSFADLEHARGLSNVLSSFDADKASANIQTLAEGSDKRAAIKTLVLVLIERALWADVSRFSEEALKEFPLEGSFAVYRAVAIIHDPNLRYAKMKRMEEIISSIKSAQLDGSQVNVQQFLLACINKGWAKPNGVKDSPISVWVEDDEVRSLKSVIQLQQFKTITPFEDATSNSIISEIETVQGRTDRNFEMLLQKIDKNDLSSLIESIKMDCPDIANVGVFQTYVNERQTKWAEVLRPELTKQETQQRFSELCQSRMSQLEDASQFVPDRKSAIGLFLIAFAITALLLALGSNFVHEAIWSPLTLLLALCVAGFIAYRGVSKNRALKKVKNRIPVLMKIRDELTNELKAIGSLTVTSDGR